MQEAIVFVTMTLALAFVSRNSPLKPGVYGFAHEFYRLAICKYKRSIRIVEMG